MTRHAPAGARLGTTRSPAARFAHAAREPPPSPPVRLCTGRYGILSRIPALVAGGTHTWWRVTNPASSSDGVRGSHGGPVRELSHPSSSTRRSVPASATGVVLHKSGMWQINTKSTETM